MDFLSKYFQKYISLINFKDATTTTLKVYQP